MLEMADVVLATGPDGAERVLLRGADLSVADGETVLLTGLDRAARRGLMSLLTGRTPPRYGTVRAPGARAGTTGDLPDGGGTLVLDGGDAPLGEQAGKRLPNAVDAAVLVLGGPGWSTAEVPGGHRVLTLSGGHFLQGPASRPSKTGSPAPEGVRMALDEVRRRTERALAEAGADDTTAALVSEVLVDADRRGHASHGVALLPTYLRRIADGGILAAAVPRLTPVTPVLASIDAGGGFGQPAADQASRWCAATAARRGLAAVAVHTNNHVGMLAAYRKPFQEHGVVGLLLNISAPSVAAPGARRPTLGSNAVCLVTPVPARDEPFCVDLATGVVAAGKIRDAGHRRAPVPPGWLLDRDGDVTTDPAQLDQGGSIPLFGDYKGLCITLIAEILAGGLAGGLVSPDVARQVTRTGEVMRCSQLFVGFSVRHFTDGSARPDAPAPVDLGALVDQLRDAVERGHDEPPQRPYFPDQLEEDKAEQAAKEGLVLPESIVAALGWDAP